MKAVTTAEMRRIEQTAVERGADLTDVMQRAGQAVGEAAMDAQASASVLVLAGPGNNGADGMIAAQTLHAAGRGVTAYCFGRKDVHPFTGPSAHAEEDPGLKQLDRLLEQSEVVVDALLGIGQSRPLEGLLGAVTQRVKERARPDTVIVAVDIPTGVNADSGAVDPRAIRADLTIAMGFLKRGHVVYPGAAYSGETRVADVSFSQDLAEDITTSVPSSDDVAMLLPVRSPESNKGTYGRVLFIGGSHNFMGAPVLSSLAAYRIGAGLVDIAVPQSVQQSVATRAVEAIFNPLPERDGRLTPEGIGQLEEPMKRASSIIFGPGMGHCDATVAAAREILQRLGDLGDTPAVIDADGLNALSDIDEWWRVSAPIVVTPHPGEMSRLTGMSIADIQRDRLEVARHFAEEWQKVVVLKGAGTVVADPSGALSINPTGGPNLATAGTGDVLSGTIGGLLAQGLGPKEAAIAGVYLHGLAGDMLRDAHGDAGTIASDLFTTLPLARMAVLEESESDL